MPFRTNAFDDDASSSGQTNIPFHPAPNDGERTSSIKRIRPSQPRQNTLIPRPFNKSHAEPRKLTVLPSHFTMLGPFRIPV